jgi:hypothetical protein
MSGRKGAAVDVKEKHRGLRPGTLLETAFWIFVGLCVILALGFIANAGWYLLLPTAAVACVAFAAGRSL